MPSLTDRSGERLLIVDTGVIRELVLFHAVQEFRFERLRRELRFIKSVDTYERCGRFIRLYWRKTTSASVVGELYQWIRKTDPTGRERLWGRIYDEFRGMGMDEEVVKLLDMDVNPVTRFGPVDVSLIELARLYTRDNTRDHPRVLTVDTALHGECRQAGLRVSLVQEITGVLG
jgi:hypothetical protein